MTDFFKRWLFALTTGFTLVFFSELFFWGVSSLGAFIEVWLYYSIVVYAFLMIVAYFRVNSVWSLFLAGAVYGWLVEGIIVHTTYESLPISISDTGLSWHALISVGIGWYAMRRALLSRYPFLVLLLAAGLGVFWGAWMPFWGFELLPNVEPFTLSSLSILTLASVPALMFSYWLQNRLTPTPFRPRKLEVGLMVVVLLFFYAFAVLAYSVALIVLPILLLVAYLGLRRYKHHNLDKPSYISTLSGQVPVLNYLSILLIIPATLVAFALVSFLNLTPWPQYTIYLLTVPGGFLLFFASLFMAWYRTRTLRLVEAPA